MSNDTKCPVCGTILGAKIPDFCPACGWECGVDITLLPSLDKPSEDELEYYRKKLTQARKRWSQTQEQLLEQAKKMADLAKELEVAKQQKQFIPPSGALSDTSQEMIPVKGGLFLMGSNDEDSDRDEQPVHRVGLSSIYIGKYPVTQELWEKVMGCNPSNFKGSMRPVEQVSWYEAVKFCNRLSLQEGLWPCYSLFGETNPDNWEKKSLDELECGFRASGYRLPTEAEWEYAARGGRKSKGYKYSGGDDIDRVAWYADNSDHKTHPVGDKKANELGIYDLSGNVFEWCWDWHGSYSSTSETNPTGPATGAYRLLRGGSWFYDAVSCRVASRNYNLPYYSNLSSGFRLCMAEK